MASYIGAAYWFTSSTSFANPAVTIGRAFTNTFAGIAPSSAAPFIAAQTLGAAAGLALAAALFGRPTPVRADSRTSVRPDSRTSVQADAPAVHDGPDLTAPTLP